MGLQEGQNIGPYRVLTPLGQGGMATVFKGYHPRLDRYVAIKIMHQAFLEDESFVTRFEREAQIVARLEHPHIVPVYDYAELNRQPYLVMKFIEGKTLKGLLQKGPLALAEILRIMTAIADALDYAHRQGVLHRDIKPSNIIIDVNNVPFLTDFGLARIAQAGESTMSQDMILGTPHYMSPEQALGKRDLDSRADLYSLGIVLYELLVGRVPFSADTPYAVIHDHIYRPLPLPSVVNPEIPPAVEAVLLKALAKEPADRYATAIDMLHALRTALENASITELSPDRATSAAVSLARLRDMITAGTPPPSSGVPAAVYFTPTPTPVPQPTPVLRRPAPPIRDPQGRRWLIGGIVACALVCAASITITSNVVTTIETAEALTFRLTAAAAPVLMTPADVDADAALATVTAAPDDASAYLGLARALWNDGRTTEARDALDRGLSLADDQLGFVLSAAATAASDDAPTAAAFLYAQALRLAEPGSQYEQVRAEAGAYLYALAESAQSVTVLDYRRLVDLDTRPQVGGRFAELTDPDALLETINARLLLQQGRLNLAKISLDQVVRDHSLLAEVHLVLGEYYSAQGDFDRAHSEWQFVLRNDAPHWVQQRAAELLGINFSLET